MTKMTYKVCHLCHLTVTAKFRNIYIPFHHLTIGLTMSETKEFNTIVRSQRRITLPSTFKEGDIVNIKAKKLVKSEENDTKKDIGNNRTETTRLQPESSPSLAEKTSDIREGA